MTSEAPPLNLEYDIRRVILTRSRGEAFAPDVMLIGSPDVAGMPVNVNSMANASPLPLPSNCRVRGALDDAGRIRLM